MKKYLIGITMLMVTFVLSCQSTNKEKAVNTKAKKAQVKVTFIELGSDKCIPCKAMQPVMKAIEEKYGDQIQIIFYDVWKDDSWAKKYNIRVIPTQVFLDENGVEFHRHQGFYPQEQIEQLLISKGLKSVSNVKG